MTRGWLLPRMGIPAMSSWEVPKKTTYRWWHEKINQPDRILLPSINDTWEAIPIDPWAEEISQHTYKPTVVRINPGCHNPTISSRNHANGQWWDQSVTNMTVSSHMHLLFLSYDCVTWFPESIIDTKTECYGLLRTTAPYSRCKAACDSINTCLYSPISLQLPARQYYLIQVLLYNQSAPAYKNPC